MKYFVSYCLSTGYITPREIVDIKETNAADAAKRLARDIGTDMVKVVKGQKGEYIGFNLTNCIDCIVEEAKE